MGALRAHFKPEFLNRVDDIVIFNPLNEEQLKHIIGLRLQDLRRILAERKITIDLTPAAEELLFIVGFDRAYGARPLKRAIQRLIQDPLALKLLDGEVKNGGISVEHNPAIDGITETGAIGDHRNFIAWAQTYRRAGSRRRKSKLD